MVKRCTLLLLLLVSFVIFLSVAQGSSYSTYHAAPKTTDSENTSRLGTLNQNLIHIMASDVCGDFICNETEDCISCPVDCGECATDYPPGSSHGPPVVLNDIHPIYVLIFNATNESIVPNTAVQLQINDSMSNTVYDKTVNTDSTGFAIFEYHANETGTFTMDVINPTYDYYISDSFTDDYNGEVTVVNYSANMIFEKKYFLGGLDTSLYKVYMRDMSGNSINDARVVVFSENIHSELIQANLTSVGGGLYQGYVNGTYLYNNGVMPFIGIFYNNEDVGINSQGSRYGLPNEFLFSDFIVEERHQHVDDINEMTQINIAAAYPLSGAAADKAIDYNVILRNYTDSMNVTDEIIDAGTVVTDSYGKAQINFTTPANSTPLYIYEFYLQLNTTTALTYLGLESYMSSTAGGAFLATQITDTLFEQDNNFYRYLTPGSTISNINVTVKVNDTTPVNDAVVRYGWQKEGMWSITAYTGTLTHSGGDPSGVYKGTMIIPNKTGEYVLVINATRAGITSRNNQGSYFVTNERLMSVHNHMYSTDYLVGETLNITAYAETSANTMTNGTPISSKNINYSLFGDNSNNNVGAYRLGSATTASNGKVNLFSKVLQEKDIGSYTVLIDGRDSGNRFESSAAAPYILTQDLSATTFQREEHVVAYSVNVTSNVTCDYWSPCFGSTPVTIRVNITNYTGSSGDVEEIYFSPEMSDIWLGKRVSNGIYEINITLPNVNDTFYYGEVCALNGSQMACDWMELYIITPPSDWPTFHHDNVRTGFVPEGGPITNNTLWTFTGDWVTSSPAVVNGIIYFGSWDTNIYALNATNGSKIWNFTTYPGPIYSSPAVADGIVYFGSDDYNVYALNATNGTKIWNFTTGDSVSSSPVVANGIVYIGSDDHNVYALNATNGSYLWNFTTSGPIYASSPAVVNGIVYIGSDDANVYALNATNGSKIWNFTTGNSVSSSPAVVDDIVYIGSHDHNVYALNATNGSKIWNFTTGDSIWTSPAVANGVIYVGAHDANVYALNATNGTKIWNSTCWDFILTSPAVAGGVVYAGSANNFFCAFNATNGSRIWDFNTGGYVQSSPAVAYGNVYVGCAGGNVYAFGPPGSGGGGGPGVIGLSITSPSAGTTTGTSVWLNATTIVNATCKYGTSPNPSTSFTGGQNKQTHWQQLPGLTNGSKTYYVNCTDAHGNYSEASVTWTVDAFGPVIVVNSPVNNTAYGKTVEFNITTNEEASICKFSLDSKANISLTDAPATEWSYTNTSMTNGTHNVKFYCTDMYGNNGSSGTTYFTVNTDFMVSINFPLNNSYNETALTVDVSTTTNASTCLISLDGKANSSMSNTSLTSWSYRLSSLTESLHNVTVWCNSSLALTDKDTVYFTVDITPPEITVLKPLNTTYGQYLPFNLTTNEPASGCKYSLDGEDYVVMNSYSPTAWYYDAPPPFTNGQHNVTFSCKDDAGNYNTTDAIYFTVDAIKPTITVISPENKTYPSSYIMLNVTTDEPASACSFEMSDVGAIMDNSSLTEWHVNITGLSNGQHNGSFLCNDLYLNHNNTSLIYFTVDTTAPVITLLSPANGYYSKTAAFNLSFRPVDNLAKNISCNIAVHSGACTWNVNVTNNTQYNLSTTSCSLADGNHTWNITCTDAAGNTNSSVRNITIDTIPPEVSITYPTNGQNFTTKNIIINVTTNETNPTILKVTAGSIVIYNSNYSSGVATKSINYTFISDGTYNITAFANDSAGNSNTSVNVTITIDTTPPIMSNIKVYNVTNSSATFNVTVNEVSLCQIYYDINTSYPCPGCHAGTTREFNFSKLIFGLNASTKYYYKWNCTDAFNNSAESSSYSFYTWATWNGTTNASTTTVAVINVSDNGKNKTVAEFEVNTVNDTNATINLLKADLNPESVNLTGTAGVYVIINSTELNSSTLNWVIIKVYYNRSALPHSIDESTLRLYLFTGGAWTKVEPGGVNTTAQYVWGNVTHFSTYAIGGTSGGGGGDGGGGGSGGGGGVSSGGNYTIDLNQSTNKVLVVGDKVSFALCNVPYSIKVTSLTANSTVLLVNSTPFNVTINVGETKLIDVNKDGTNDVSIYFQKVDAGKMYLTFVGIGVCQQVQLVQNGTQQQPSEILQNATTPFCGDKICQSTEDCNSCVIDCDVCPAAEENQPLTMFVIIAAVIGATVVAVVLIYLRRKGKSYTYAGEQTYTAPAQPTYPNYPAQPGTKATAVPSKEHQLDDYARRMFAKGIPEDEVISTMKKAGWDNSTIRKAVSVGKIPSKDLEIVNNYINKLTKQGFSKAQIREALLNADWKEDIVDELL